MSSAPPPAVEPRVLVVHVSFAVGSALAQRLLGCSVVSLASASAALGGVLAEGTHEVLVLCPYLRADERTAVLAQADRLPHPPVVVELSADLGAVVTHGCERTAAARTVLAALEPVAA